MSDAVQTRAVPQKADFLFELGTEELPPKALTTLEQALREGIVTRLAALGLKHGEVTSFAAPRRLAVRVKRLALAQPVQQIRRRGPPLRAAYDAAGVPTRAAQAFAASCGVPLEDIARERDEKGNEYLFHSGTQPGASAASLLPGVINEALAALPIPKRMRWGAGEAQFVRPVHWLVLLLGNDVVPATILDTPAGGSTRGHRFHAPKELHLATPAAYERVLRTRGFVLAHFAERRERVREQVLAAGVAAGGRAIVSSELLDEVTSLVEWPVAVAGRYEERFLALPREVLVATLQDHQRYFPVDAADGSLLPWFITVSNIESRDPAAVRAGNERVVRPRLADAAFFGEQDRRTPLAARIEGLERVTYQAQLGSIGAKVQRIAALGATLAPACKANAAWVARAAQLAKCDLLTTMVGEFPELQGVMGAYYAAADGEAAEVATAIREHYLPRGAGDALPATPTGTAIALADRLDTLAGIFAIGQKPTGTRDPFGLRRAAIGVLRICREAGLDIDLRALVAQAVAAQPVAGLAPRVAAVATEVCDYVFERARAQYLEDAASAVTTEAFDAVLATVPRSPRELDARLRALVGFLALPEAAALTAADKRIANILKKSAAASEGATPAVNESLLKLAAEQQLHAALAGCRGAFEAAMARGDYAAALATLAGLRPAVDAFFDGVLVNDPDAALRDNRLALLATLRAQFTRIADLSRLPG
jgi:glycyl-tRNA synthetase beta chain